MKLGAAAAAALLCALLAGSAAAQPEAKPNTGPPKSCAASIISSTYDVSTVVGVSQTGQLISTGDMSLEGTDEVLTTFAVGKRTCDFQTPSVLAPNATTTAEVSGGGAWNFSTYDLAGVSKRAEPFQAVTYNVSGVPGNGSDDPSGNFNVTLTLGAVLRYSRYFGSPVIGRWALLGHLNATILLNNNDTTGNTTYTFSVYPLVQISSDSQTVMVNYAVVGCSTSDDSDTRRRSLLAGFTVCKRASGPGGGGMSIFTWNKKTGVYEETYRTMTALSLSTYADPWSVNPMGDAQVASLSADGKTAAIMDAYATLSVYARNKTGWAPLDSVNLTTLVPSNCPFVVGASLSKDGSWLNTMVAGSDNPAYTAFWNWDKKTKTYVGACSATLDNNPGLPGYTNGELLERSQYGFGETPSNRFRVGYVSTLGLGRRRSRALLKGPSSFGEFVVDFAVKDLKKDTCTALMVFSNFIVPTFGGGIPSERVFVTGDGLNVAYTNTNASRLLMSSLPVGGWTPPGGGGK